MILCSWYLWFKFGISECMFAAAEAFGKWEILAPLYINNKTLTTVG